MAILETEYLDLLGTEIPVQKTYEFSGQTYIFFFKKNDLGFFTVEVYDVNTEEFLYSNKLVYGQPIMDSKLAPFEDLITPLNLGVVTTGQGITDINSETLGNDIKLYTNIIVVGD
jgi:hypothetical protein